MALSFILMVLRIVGLWPGNPVGLPIFLILAFSFHFTFVGLVGQVSYKAKDVLDVATFLYSVVLNLLVSFKYYHVFLSNKQFKPLVDTLEIIYKQDNNILKESAHQAKRISVGFFSFSTFTAIGFAVFPMLENTYLGEVVNGTYISPNKLSCEVWYPHMYETPVFELVYFWVALCCIGCGYITSAYDSFFVSLVILVCGQFKLLQSASRDVFTDLNVYSDGAEYVKSNEQKIASRSKLISNSPQDGKSKSENVTSKPESMTWAQELQNLMSGPGELSSVIRKRTAKERLTQIIQYHQGLLEVVFQLNKYFSSMMLFQFICSISLICLTGFQALRSPPGGLEFVFRTCYMLMVVSELYVLCWTGEKLIEESALVADATYESDWTSTQNSLKQNQKLIILRAQRPVKLCIGKFTTVGMNTFTEIIRISYSFFTVLREFLTS